MEKLAKTWPESLRNKQTVRLYLRAIYWNTAKRTPGAAKEHLNWFNEYSRNDQPNTYFVN